MKNKDEMPALILIPDMTGFTQFMSEATLELSIKVIPSLLEKIISANTLNLNVAGIEGDAILFYRDGKLPSLKSLLKQCKKIFTDFDKQLLQLHDKYSKEEFTFYEKLKLKIVIHTGKISITEIDERTKLIGEDVIIAHRLLKNSIPEGEYVLISENCLSNYDKDELKKLLPQGRLLSGSEEYEHIGVVKYKYLLREALFETIKKKVSKPLETITKR